MNSEAAVTALAGLVTARLGLVAQKRWPDGIASLIPELCALAGTTDIPTIIKRARHEPFDTPLWRRLTGAVAIGETRFLRQRSWFRQIERSALATVVQQRRREGLKRLRLWSAGCSTGEEPYSLAVLLREALPDFDEWRIEILGTDIRADAIEAAEQGLFDSRQLRELEPWQVSRYFMRTTSKRLAVAPMLREQVQFRVENLVDRAAAGKGWDLYDLILCRNVLMYMNPRTQRAVARHLVGSLHDQGWLAVSPAEALADWFKPLSPVNMAEAILFTRNAERRQAGPTGPIAVQPAPAQVPHAPFGAPATARAASRPMVEPVRTDVAAALAQARALADRGSLDEARACCETTLSADRLNTDARLLLAEICCEIGDVQAAYEAARIAVYVAPQSPQAHFLLAGALFRLGRGARATRALATARILAAAAGTILPDGDGIGRPADLRMKG